MLNLEVYCIEVDNETMRGNGTTMTILVFGNDF